jgi:hypothetical protein
MTGSVKIVYQQGTTFNSMSAAIKLDGAIFEMGSNEFFQLSGTFVFNQLIVSSGLIQIFNNAAGTAVSGEIDIPLIKTGSADPEITVTNFSGVVMVGWTASGGGGQLTPVTESQSFTLSNFSD